MYHTLRNWLVGILAVLLLLVLAYQWALQRERKQELVELPKPLQVADAENAFAALQALGQEFDRELDADSSLSARFMRHDQGEEWDAGFVAELLQDKEPLCAAMDSICKLPHCQAPLMKGPQDERPNMMPHIRLVRWRMLAMQQALRQEDGDTACAHFKAALTLANRIENDANNYLSYLLGVIAYAITDKQIEDLLQADLLTASQLAELQHLLAQGAQPEALQRALWGECQYGLASRELMQDVILGRITAEEAWPGGDELDPPTNWFIRAWTRWSYMPKLSRLLVRDSFAQLVARCEQPVTEWVETGYFKDPGIFATLLLPNGAGRELAYNSHTRVLPLFVVKAERVARDARRLNLALLRYQLDHDSVPQTLEELVPAYMAAVPRDPFDGAVLRYLPEQQLVYSVGRDCLDQGGSREPVRDPLNAGGTSFRLDEQDLVYALELAQHIVAE